MKTVLVAIILAIALAGCAVPPEQPQQVTPPVDIPPVIIVPQQDTQPEQTQEQELDNGIQTVDEPLYSNMLITNITETSAVITFTSNESIVDYVDIYLSDVRVGRYGSGIYTTSHVILVQNLVSGTTYQAITIDKELAHDFTTTSRQQYSYNYGYGGGSYYYYFPSPVTPKQVVEAWNGYITVEVKN